MNLRWAITRTMVCLWLGFTFLATDYKRQLAFALLEEVAQKMLDRAEVSLRCLENRAQNRAARIKGEL